MSNAIEVKDIIKTFQNGDETVHALKGISLEVGEGELLAIMGSSGSGKSSLLHILGALDQPDSGKIYLNGIHKKDYCKEPVATFIRSRYIGFIFQQYNLLNDLTVKENIQLPLILEKKKNVNMDSRINKLLSVVGLDDKVNSYPNELSGGQQQRVAVARAMIRNPKILLADEPTGNLDYNTATDIIELIRRMSYELNQSTILVTHDPRIATYADRVIFLHDGVVKSEIINSKKDSDLETLLFEFK